MTLQEVWKQANAKSCARDGDSRAFDLSCLFEHTFGVSRYRLPLVGQQQALPGQAEAFFALVRRYESGEPLQYLLGEWEFYGLPFEVGPGVLIPRADTETLVETALGLLDGLEKPVVADLCAGSGCVGTAISHQRPDAQVFALEISDAAYPYLCRNIQRNHVRVTPLLCDVLAPPPLLPLDLAVSNPPYIPADEMCTLEPPVHHEPVLALFGGEDGYDFYRALPGLYLPLLKKGGWIAFETGYQQAHTVCGLLEKAGFTDARTVRDLCGIERVALARKPI